MTGVPASAANGSSKTGPAQTDALSSEAEGGTKPPRGAKIAAAAVNQASVWNIANLLTMLRLLLVPAFDDATWQIVLYAVLSLTLIRMLPVGLALIGTGVRRPTVAFLGWFGPRGLASIVFALLLVEEGGLPNDELNLVATFVAVASSVFAHGISAARATRRYADWPTAQSATRSAPVEQDG